MKKRKILPDLSHLFTGWGSHGSVRRIRLAVEKGLVEDPLKMTFVYKTGIPSNFSVKDFKPRRKNAAAVHTDAALCSCAGVEDNKLCLHSSSETCGDSMFDVWEREINSGKPGFLI